MSAITGTHAFACRIDRIITQFDEASSDDYSEKIITVDSKSYKVSLVAQNESSKWVTIKEKCKGSFNCTVCEPAQKFHKDATYLIKGDIKEIRLSMLDHHLLCHHILDAKVDLIEKIRNFFAISTNQS
ncbi:MAG: hypothetical protein JHC93_07605 [Parachlamydiales bacterium]|nr:hypothetical protein [Parachlamydiales bacterium]